MPSKDASHKIRVIAAVIRRDSTWLICKRPLHKRHGGLWEFPGGKIRDGESDFDAASRELGEELLVDVTGVGRLLFTTQDPGSAFSIEFVEVEIDGEPQAIEHSEIRWCRLSKLTSLPLAPADAKFVRTISSKEGQ